MFARSDFYFRLQLPLIIIHITCISLSLRRTSAPIHLTSVLGTQETSCILIAGLLERDIFDLFLPEFDKPWVIHLRETCCCSTNLCTWRPNTIYKNRSVCRHQSPSLSFCASFISSHHSPFPTLENFLHTKLHTILISNISICKIVDPLLVQFQLK
jgi:hypothetical protein